MKKLGYGILAITVSLTASIASATGAPHGIRGQDMRSAFMRVYGEALPPIGHVGFCRRHPAECRRQAAKAMRLGMTEGRKQDLQFVNDMVNRMVKPVSDQDLYGRIEHWTYPAGSGDCEDYVLLKSRLLLERGWPQSALLITVVRDENNEGHAVLTVRTPQGDYVLDNKRPEVLRWNRTGYSFVKRQSSRDPRSWVSLAPSDAPRAAPISGTRSN